MSTMKPNLEYTLSYEDKRKTPISQNDSFSVKKYLNNEKRSLRLTVNKNRLLPPLNNLNLSL
jgi:hypothetical protein